MISSGRARLPLATIMLIACGGCMGTQTSRYDFAFPTRVGKWPYQAVATDFLVIRDGCTRDCLCGITSLPLDFLFDTVLLPIDLALWPFGYEKDPLAKPLILPLPEDATENTTEIEPGAPTGGEHEPPPTASPCAP